MGEPVNLTSVALSYFILIICPLDRQGQIIKIKYNKATDIKLTGSPIGVEPFLRSCDFSKIKNNYKRAKCFNYWATIGGKKEPIDHLYMA